MLSAYYVTDPVLSPLKVPTHLIPTTTLCGNCYNYFNFADEERILILLSLFSNLSCLFFFYVTFWPTVALYWWSSAYGQGSDVPHYPWTCVAQDPAGVSNVLRLLQH